MVPVAEHGSLSVEQISTCPVPQLVAHCDPVKLEPRSNEHVESYETVPVAQQTGPAALPWQSSGSVHCHTSEPVIGHAEPAVWHDDWSPVVGSQHSCPAAQWTAPVGVNGQ